MHSMLICMTLTFGFRLQNKLRDGFVEDFYPYPRRVRFSTLQDAS
jgi:isocitrate dehydrogenase kinase/phosphatase